MATHKKTIRVPVNFGTPADIATGVATVIGTPTIYIPENSVGNPVTFTSVMLYIAAQDTSTVTGATLALTAAVTLAPAAASTVTITGTVANTGENWGYLLGPIDYTAYFNTNYGTGTSKATSVSVTPTISTGTGTATRGVYGYFEVTYTYSDATATARIQTVCVPFESSTTSLPTISTAVATLPQLTGTGGWLNGYASPVIRHRWVEIKGNVNNNATTTAVTLSYGLDVAAATALPQRIAALASDTWQLYQIDTSGLSTTATHTLNLLSSVASKWSNLVINEWITFEYTVAGTTEVLNYVELPISFASPAPGTTSAVALRSQDKILINEPATITMRNCAAEINYVSNASSTVAMSVGAQASYRSYAMAASVVAGQFSFQHRIDAGSGAGAALTLTTGSNTINLNLYRSAGLASNISGVLRLLYSSGVASTGVDTHNATRKELLKSINFTTITDESITDSFAIPNTNYYLHNGWLHYYSIQAVTQGSLSSQASILAGESIGAGWEILSLDQATSDAESSYVDWYAGSLVAGGIWIPYPTYPEIESLNITGSRSFRTTMSTAGRYGATFDVSYHNITSSVAGTIAGSSGGTIVINLYQSGSEELYATTTRTGNGTYSFNVYNSFASYTVTAYESTTLKGMSKKGTPATDFDIDLAGGGGGGLTIYGYGSA